MIISKLINAHKRFSILKLTNSTENTLPDIKLPGKNGSTVKLSSL